MKNKICNLCTGCGACSCVCPKHCISMQENAISERIPVINKKECINCGLCKKVCPQINEIPKLLPQKCYVAWSKDKKDLIYSASGGVAAVIARHQIQTNNIVYGCDYNSSVDLDFFSVKCAEDILRMESSKYSQSNAISVFNQIKNDLKNKIVVFIGTPCQVAGLRSFLKTDYDNLITIDLVCHGTPPNTYLKKYLQEMNIGLPIDKIRFRGEYNQQLTVWKNNDIIYQKPYKEDLYFSAFYKNKISMNACYVCHYAQSKRVSDITIADFWGLGKLKGIKKKSERPSLILLNTNKGKKFFNSFSDDLVFEERPIEEAIAGNGRLNKPPGKSHEAVAFQKFYRLSSFSNAVALSARYQSIEDSIVNRKSKMKKFNKRVRKSIKRRLHI